MKKLFPPYLNEGSSGAAVDYLQGKILNRLDPSNSVEITGEHTGQSVEAVKRLQIRLGFTGVDVDGNFGPGTRKALREQFGIDVETIPAPASGGETEWTGPRHEGTLPWPQHF